MVVLVTGARSGFGRLIAEEAARRGHVVYASMRDPSAGADLLDTADGDLRLLQLDVTVPEQREAAIATIVAEQGRLDVLVNNAGLALGGLLELVSEDELRRQFEVNVMAPWALTRAALPHLRRQRSGTILMMSSMSGRMAWPGLGAYASSKHALEAMSESWRHELAGLGIRVVLVEPGPFRTDIWDRNEWVAAAMEDPPEDYRGITRALRERLVAKAAASAEDPRKVALLCCDLMESPSRPALRHPIGRGTGVRELVKRAVPFRLVEWAVARALREESG